MNTDEIELAIDELLADGCGGCGRSLPRPGTKCPKCGTWPDTMREEAAAVLAEPGVLSMHKADAAERAAVDVMKAFVAATAVPDRLRKRAEIEQQQALVQQALADTGRDHAEALRRVAAAQRAEKHPKADLAEAVAGQAAAVAALEEAERTKAGPRAEIDARTRVAQAALVVEKYQRIYDEAAAKTASARRDAELAGLRVLQAETARDEQAARLLHVDEVPPSPRRLMLLSHPLVMYMAELAEDQASENPQRLDEWGNAMALVHTLAGALGLLAMAEEGAAPRVLEEFTGPLSRAADVAAIHRRLSGSRHLLPPGPGEASMTLVRNEIP